MITRLEDIGFYTLSDERCRQASVTSPLERCELVLTGRCNFHCQYCRRVGGPDMPMEKAVDVVSLWAEQGLKNIRFSGGEPTLYHGLYGLVDYAKQLGCEHVAVSSNGSAPWSMYNSLLAAGANDFSISLDACCAADGDAMAGVEGAWDAVVENIHRLSKAVYTTVGVVLTDANAMWLNDIITFAASLGVDDIRVIPAAQNGDRLSKIEVSPEVLDRYPILRYRVENLQASRPVRGLGVADCRSCGLCLDDMAVNGDYHYPCIIYLREGGEPIGRVGPKMRQERLEWYKRHNTKNDPICLANCLDVCVEYNDRYERWHREAS